MGSSNQEIDVHNRNDTVHRSGLLKGVGYKDTGNARKNSQSLTQTEEMSQLPGYFTLQGDEDL